MSIFRLSDTDANTLAELPETGMGFQIVKAKFQDHTSEVFMVLGSKLVLPAQTNAQLLEGFEEITRTQATTAEEILKNATEKKLISEPKIKIIASRLDREIGIDTLAKELLKEQPLSLNISTAPISAYYRFSAFNPDKRVQQNGDFLKGTYATTYNDIRMVPSGLAAVGRYALPNPLSAKYVYVILTQTVPQIVGTTVPNFSSILNNLGDCPVI